MEVAAPVEAAADAAPVEPQEGQEGTTEAPAADPKPPEPKPAPRTFKGRVNGREIDLSEDEVIQSGLTAAQMRRAASEQFQQAQKLRSEAEEMRKALQSDPIKAFEKELGGNGKFRELAEKYLLEQLQLEQMDPNQRARMDAEQKAKEAERRVKEMEDGQQRQKSEALQKQYAEHYDKEFSEALKGSQLPKTTETVRRMASLARKSVEMGLQLSAKDIAGLVRQDFVAEQAAVLSAMDGDAILSILGPETMKRIRTADLARVKGAPAAPVVAPKPVATRKAGEPNPHLMTRDEWMRSKGMDPDEW